jgi:thymidylate synthase ThyX
MPTSVPTLLWWLFTGAVGVAVFLMLRMLSKYDAEIRDILTQIRDILAQRLVDQREYNEFVRKMMELKGTHDAMTRGGTMNPHRRSDDE